MRSSFGLCILLGIGLAFLAGHRLEAAEAPRRLGPEKTCTYSGVPIFDRFLFSGPEDPVCADFPFRLENGAYPFEAGAGQNRVEVPSPGAFLAVQNLGDRPAEVGIEL